MYRFPLLTIALVFLISCSTANNKPVLVEFSSDSSAVVCSMIDAAGLLQVKNTAGIDTAFAAVLSVMEIIETPDEELLELPVPGKLTVTDSLVVFKPVHPFVKGKKYLVSTYLNTTFGDATMLLKGSLNGSVKPVQVVLNR